MVKFWRHHSIQSGESGLKSNISAIYNLRLASHKRPFHLMSCNFKRNSLRTIPPDLIIITGVEEWSSCNYCHYFWGEILSLWNDKESRKEGFNESVDEDCRSRVAQVFHRTLSSSLTCVGGWNCNDACGNVKEWHTFKTGRKMRSFWPIFCQHNLPHGSETVSWCTSKHNTHTHFDIW